jgi:hypothetical protein
MLVFLLLWAPVVPAAESPRIEVTYRDGSLSVRSSGASLHAVLVEISRRTGVDIALETGLAKPLAEETVAVDFEDVPLEDGLRRLLGPRSTILLYDARGLTEVRIYVEGTGAFRSVRPATGPGGARQGVAAREMTDDDRERARRMDQQREREGHAPHVEQLVRTLDDLSRRGDEQGAVRTALDVLERERDPEMLETALNGLLGVESVPVDPLLRFAEAQVSPDLSIQALEILSEHGRSDPRVTGLLSKLSRQGSSEAVREAARNLLDDLQD